MHAYLNYADKCSSHRFIYSFTNVSNQLIKTCIYCLIVLDSCHSINIFDGQTITTQRLYYRKDDIDKRYPT